jgi:hypothetical protein
VWHKKKISLHSLRHSYATHLIEIGVDLLEAQKILEHHSILITSRYNHLTTRTQHNAHQALNELKAQCQSQLLPSQLKVLSTMAHVALRQVLKCWRNTETVIISGWSLTPVAIAIALTVSTMKVCSAWSDNHKTGCQPFIFW